MKFPFRLYIKIKKIFPVPWRQISTFISSPITSKIDALSKMDDSICLIK